MHTLPAHHALLASSPSHSGGLLVGGLVLAVLIGYALLFIGALVSIVSSPLSGGMKLVWVVFAFVAPFLGSLLWFLVGRGAARRQIAYY